MLPDRLMHVHLQDLTGLQKFLGFLISMIPASFSLLILYNLIKLFKRYEHLIIFSKQSVIYIRNIAYCLILREITTPIYQALLSLTVTWNLPKDQHLVYMSLSTSNISVIMLGVLTILISWIMLEATKLNEENKNFV